MTSKKNLRLAIYCLLISYISLSNQGCMSTTVTNVSSNSKQKILANTHQIAEQNNLIDETAYKEGTPLSEIPVSKIPEGGSIDLVTNLETSISPLALNLEAIEQLALQHNPSIRQAQAAVSKASGIRHQVQLYPNPVVGYTANQLADEQTDQHTVFVEQEFITSNKLEKNAQVLDHEVQNLKWQVEQQRRTVLADVKQSYYEVLGAQQLLDLTREFSNIAVKSVELTKQLKKIGEGTNVDILQSEIQMQQIQISQKQAIANLNGAWKKLTATMGLPELPQQQLLGELPTDPTIYLWDTEYARILKESPEVMAAHYRVTRALAFIARQKVQADPNISVSLAAGYDRATNSQMINTQVGMPIPFYNHNEGNLSAAYADFCRSTQELKRIELSLKARLAQVAKEYESASASVILHRDEVVPKSQQLLDLAELSYKAGEINFLQVLVIRKTYFDAQFAYIAARSDLAQSQVYIEEYLLSGSLNNSTDTGFDDNLRGQSLNGQ